MTDTTSKHTNKHSAEPQPVLQDGFGRKIRYLRLSVTDRCDFRCVYCMAEDMTFMPRSEVLSFEEIVRLSQIFVNLGVEKIRITGGEPLIRKDICALFEKLGQVSGLNELTVTTNGSRLQQYAQTLANAGVKRVNVSLDTLNPILFKKLTRFGDLAEVLRGIEVARKVGFERIKLNAVLMKNQNADEAEALAMYALERDMDISFIEEMPLGEISSHQRHAEFISSAELREQLAQRLTLKPDNYQSGGPSRYWKASGYSGRVGFISPHSDNFCASCNRVRVTASGRLLLCLGNEDSVDLRTLLRQHDDQTVANAISNAMHIKPERHHFNNDEQPQILRFMNATGG